MPDVTLMVRDLKDAEDAERLELMLTRLGFVNTVNVDAKREMVAVSYEGGGDELEKIEGAIKESGHDPEPSPGAGRVEA